MKTFGERILEARRKKGLTSSQLAASVGTYKSYICIIVSGAVNPPSPKLTAKLCKILDLPLVEMLTLAWWEKRPRGVTEASMGALLDGILEQRMRDARSPKEAS